MIDYALVLLFFIYLPRAQLVLEYFLPVDWWSVSNMIRCLPAPCHSPLDWLI